MQKSGERQEVRERTVYAVLCALLALLLASAALYLEHAALRAGTVLLCTALLGLCLTVGLRRRISGLRREAERYRADCTHAQERETLLRRQSELDTLTGALNRAAFAEYVQQLLGSTADTHAFLMLDLDGFKQVNDTCGHDVGDRTLAAVAASIRGALRPRDLLCRIGGDEFAILLLEVGDDTVIARRAKDVCDAVRRTVCGCVPLSASVGAAVFPRDGTKLSVLYEKADKGLYRSKRAGRDGVTFFRPDMPENT